MSAATPVRLVLLVAAPLLSVARAGAQERLVGGVDAAATPLLQSWRFGSAAPIGDSLAVTGASQLSIPLAVRVPVGRRLTLDLTGGYALGAVSVRAAGATGGGAGAATGAPAGATTTRRLDGPTDLRVRATAQLVPDRLLLAAGANLPTGTVRLDGAQFDAVRVLGAPALGFRTPVLGTGPAATLGLVLVRQVGAWGLAAGSAYEQRGTYTPLEATIAGVRTPTDLRPGGAVHLSLGADRLVGAHRLAVALTGDVYGGDELRLPTARAASPTPGAPTPAADVARYRLGPTLGASAELQVATTRLRDLTLAATHRYRAPFTGPEGTRVAGSGGHFLDASAAGAVGRPRGRALTFAVEGRYQTGLAFDNTVTTAGVASAGLTLGVDLPAGGSLLHPYAQLQQGRLDTGAGSTSITGLAFGLTLGSR